MDRWAFGNPRLQQYRRVGVAAREDAALILLFDLMASGQIKLRRIDGGRKIVAVLQQPTAVAA